MLENNRYRYNTCIGVLSIGRTMSCPPVGTVSIRGAAAVVYTMADAVCHQECAYLEWIPGADFGNKTALSTSTEIITTKTNNHL